MSTSPTCTVGALIPNPCTSQGACVTSFGTGNTGLVITNAAGEAIVGYNREGTTPICFTLPAVQNNNNVSYSIVVPGATPVQFALYGQSTGVEYSTITSSVTPPAYPIIVQPQVNPFVNPSKMPANWQTADIRKDKPLWVLIVAGSLLVIAAIVLIVVGVQRNQQVFRVYAQLKGAKDDEAMTMLAEDDALEEEYYQYRGTSYIVAGSILLAIVIGLTVAIMFLPGYPLSKYMSYGYCQAYSAADPSNKWFWSIPPDSGFWSFACKAMGACICRSYVLETECLLYRIGNPLYQPNPWQSSLKKPPLPRNCLCCSGGECGQIINGTISGCYQ